MTYRRKVTVGERFSDFLWNNTWWLRDALDKVPRWIKAPFRWAGLTIAFIVFFLVLMAIAWFLRPDLH